VSKKEKKGTQMETIKYKVWSRGEKRWVDEACCIDRFGILSIWDSEIGDVVPVTEGFVVVKFAGILDRNGEEIYFDSDIVEFEEEPEVTIVGTLTIDMDLSLGYCIRDGESELHYIGEEDLGRIRIVGNLYVGEEGGEEESG